MSTDYISMPDFLEGLQTFATSGFDPAEVHKYLSGNLITPESLEPYTSFRADRYTRNLVYKDETFELLVICWGIGHRAPIHGHEGEYCWARVESGSLRLTNYRELSETPLILDRLNEPVDGQRAYLDGPANIHEVEHLVAFGQVAISLHVYSHPFADCDIYDLAKGAKQRTRLTYDTMFGKPISSHVSRKRLVQTR